MRLLAFVLLFAFCCVECRKSYAPIDKNANLAFINMESGGVRHPPTNVGPAPIQTPQPPLKPVVPKPVQPIPPIEKPVPHPVQPTPPIVKPVPHPVQPTKTPGPGSVKQLVTFYDSQGKASQIRPYSYSQAVKQG